MFQIFTALAHMLKHGYLLGLENQVLLPNANTTDRTVYWDSVFETLKCFRQPTVSLPLYHEQAFHYTEIPANDNIQLYGYFQSWKYFEQQKEQILCILRIQDMQDAARKTVCGRSIVGTTGIHFRFGDYVKLQKYHPLMTKEYYANALKHIHLEDPDVRMISYICEDQDLDRVNEIIEYLKATTGSGLRFQRCKGDEDQDEMILFSLCKNHILANSTFGWWGAYLSDRKGIVCYPSIWFGPEKGTVNTTDLFLDTWTKIDAAGAV